MIVSVDLSSPVPVFEQLRSQIELQILAGQLPPGHRLPAIRHLATDLGLARGTIAKVYETLVRDGLVVTQGRHGTVVARRTTPDRTQHIRTVLGQALDNLAVLSSQLDVSATDLHAELDAAFARLHAVKPTSPS